MAPHGGQILHIILSYWTLHFFKHNFCVKPYVTREPGRNRRLNEHGIWYIFDTARNWTHNLFHPNAVQCCTMLYNVVQCCTMLYNVVWCCTMLYKAVRCCTILYDAVQCCTMLYNAARCCTMLYDAVPCCTILSRYDQLDPFLLSHALKCILGDQRIMADGVPRKGCGLFLSCWNHQTQFRISCDGIRFLLRQENVESGHADRWIWPYPYS